MSSRSDRQRNEDQEREVPAAGDPDRKRVLNVLAQRRYRQRKRERMAALEERAKATAYTPIPSASDQHGDGQSPKSSTTGSSEGGVNFDADVMLQDPFPQTSNPPASIGDFMIPNFPSDVDFSLLLSDEEMNAQSALLPDPGFDVDFDAAAAAASNMSGSSSSSDVVAFSPRQTSDTAFMDDAIIDVPVLKLLKASVEIASRLGSAEMLWDPASMWTIRTLPSALPSHFSPTPAQQQIPHHPVLDLLPWPEVRTKLICTFHMPLGSRPPSARDPNALVNLVMDLEDTKEGCRLEGEDGLRVENWEVGEAIYRNWWWALDRSVIERSNELRLRRGALRLGAVAA